MSQKSPVNGVMELENGKEGKNESQRLNEVSENRKNQTGNRPCLRKSQETLRPLLPGTRPAERLTIRRHHDDPTYRLTHCKRSQVLLHITPRLISHQALVEQAPSRH